MDSTPTTCLQAGWRELTLLARLVSLIPLFIWQEPLLVFTPRREENMQQILAG